ATEIYTLSLHDALPIWHRLGVHGRRQGYVDPGAQEGVALAVEVGAERAREQHRLRLADLGEAPRRPHPALVHVGVMALGELPERRLDLRIVRLGVDAEDRVVIAKRGDLLHRAHDGGIVHAAVAQRRIQSTASTLARARSAPARLWVAPGKVTSRVVTPAARSAASVAEVHSAGICSSASPWRMSTGGPAARRKLRGEIDA